MDPQLSALKGLIAELQSNCNLAAISDCNCLFIRANQENNILDFMYFYGERGGTRTLDPMIKSHVLYRLSYALT